MYAYFTCKDISPFKVHFKIGTPIETRKIELLRHNKHLHYMYKRRARRVFPKDNKWFIVYRNETKELTDDEIMNGKFVDRK